MEYRFIEDLPADVATSVPEETRNLALLWKTQAKKLKDSRALKQFNEQLAREWAIETGIIEGLYTLDRGVTQILIEQGIDASLISHDATNTDPHELVKVLNDQHQALEGVFRFVKDQRRLSTSYIKELHAQLTRNQGTTTAYDQFGHPNEVPVLHGEWKTLPNNPTRPDGVIHSYCPPEHVAAEMDRLIAMHRSHTVEHVDTIAESAWLHHRFTQIHPFQDGNGRVARALATLVLLRDGWFPLVIRRDERRTYIDALEAADDSDLVPLVELFTLIQKRAIMRAFSLSEQVLQRERSFDALFEAAVTRLQSRAQEKEKKIERVFEIADHLVEIGYRQIETLAARLRDITNSQQVSIGIYPAQSDETNHHFYRHQIINTAHELGYWADTRSYRRWLRLTIREERRTSIVVSIHSLGHDFAGALVAGAFIEFRDDESSEDSQVPEVHTIVTEPFQFTYMEKTQEVAGRFSRWLDNALLAGLDHWRAQL